MAICFIPHLCAIFIPSKQGSAQASPLHVVVHIAHNGPRTLQYCLGDSRDIQTSYVDHADHRPYRGYGYSLEVYSLLPIALRGLALGSVFYVMLHGIQIRVTPR